MFELRREAVVKLDCQQILLKDQGNLVTGACFPLLPRSPVVHFVDDFGSIQPIPHAASGFQGFGHLNSTLGFHMTQSKEHKTQTQNSRSLHAPHRDNPIQLFFFTA